MRPLLYLLLCPLLLPAQNPLATLIETHQADLGVWASNPDKYEIQVLYTEIDRKEDGTVALQTHRWGAADTTQYFYPASTVKMPAAILALQRLNELGVVGLDHRTPLFHGAGTAPAAAPQTAVSTDATAPSGLPTVENYLRKIFLVSDNDAYCRLFEWLGPTYLNQALQRVGITGGRLQHRVGVGGFDTETHAWLNPVRFADGYQTLYQIGERHDPWYDPLPHVNGQFRGEGFT
ncbi:MAG: serine hydrolase, partial [Bacteroidota bacterium]